jgi:hypothetical protein
MHWDHFYCLDFLFIIQALPSQFLGGRRVVLKMQEDF